MAAYYNFHKHKTDEMQLHMKLICAWKSTYIYINKA